MLEDTLVDSHAEDSLSVIAPAQVAESSTTKSATKWFLVYQALRDDLLAEPNH